MSERKVHLTDNSLHNLINDCLRFILYFFQPIQLSAQHIYHTALPLSPETSILRSQFFRNHSSWKEDLTTQQALPSSIPPSWGQIIRTIKADSGGFTDMAVAGERIVAVCEDNTVNVYDAVTGVLKSSLNPPQQVTQTESSPDGSTLFFAHKRAREITAWDTQTGGLVHTFATTSDISNIAVSSEETYLGCSSDGTFEFWEVESRCGGSHSLGQAIASIHWLEPENQVALALKGVVVILKVTTGVILRKHCLGERVRGLAFFPHRDQFGVLLDWEINNMIEIIDIRTDRTRTSPTLIPRDVSHFTFSDNGNRVIYATKTGHLQSSTLEYPPTQHDHLNHLGTIHSMSLLRSGHLVVNSGGSIQILGLEYTPQSGAAQDPEIAHVYQLDDGRAICSSSGDHMNVNLLDTETMKTLASHRIELGGFDTAFTPRLLCTSVLCFQRLNGFALRRVGSHRIPLWEKPSLRPALLGALSPHGADLVIVNGGEDPSGGGDWELSVLNPRDGKISNDIRFIRQGRLPSKIKFTSRKQFYTEERQAYSESTLPRDEDMSDCKDNHVQTTSTPSTTSKHPSPHPQQLDITSRTTSTTNSEGYPRIGVCHKEYCIRKTFSLKPTGSRIEIEEVSREEMLTTNPYALDDNLEWVVDVKSRRVCWLPPGYVTGIKDGHFFAGSSIVTAGKDGVMRKLTFREPGSDW